MPTQATISDPDHGHFLGWARAWEILEIGYGSTLEIEIKVEQDTPSIHERLMSLNELWHHHLVVHPPITEMRWETE